MNSDQKIFISHSSKDEKLVTSFIEKILNLGLGVDRSKIFYTSAKDTAPKSGTDFKNAIKEKIVNSKAVIQIITDAYKKSEVCLNEMGAAWVLSDKVIPFILEPVSFETIGFIHASNFLLRLNLADDLFKFQDDYPEIYDNRRINQANYHKQVNDFISDIKSNSFRNGWY